MEFRESTATNTPPHVGHVASLNCQQEFLFFDVEGPVMKNLIRNTSTLSSAGLESVEWNATQIIHSQVTQNVAKLTKEELQVTVDYKSAQNFAN